MSNKTNTYIFTGLLALLAIFCGLFGHELINNQMQTPPGYAYSQGTMSDPSNPGVCYKVEFSYPEELTVAESAAYAFNPANAAHVRTMFATTCGNSHG